MKEVTILVILLFLAAAGLTELLVLLFGALFRGGEKEYILQRGSAKGLEYRLRSAAANGYVSVLLRDSLDREALDIASRFSHVVICDPEELFLLIEEREP